MFLYPLLYGPQGRPTVVDASGRLVLNATVDADAYVLVGSVLQVVFVDQIGHK